MNIVKDCEISINAADWIDLNRFATKEEIINLISDTIGTLNLPLPLNPITIEEAEKDFIALCDLDTKPLLCTAGENEEIFTKYPYKWELGDKYINTCNVGNKASNYFHQESRFHCDSINSPSPYRVWTIEKFRKNMLKSLWSLKFKEINNKNLRQSLALRTYTASQFRPSAAKCVYNHFNSEFVMDFSSGWGDRLAGFYGSKALHYSAYDPNTRLIDGYIGQKRLYEQVIKYWFPGLEKYTNFTCKPAEEADLKYSQFDTVFTSPPYFLVERYSQELTQSWKRYKKLEAWLEKFLFAVLEKAWKTLQPFGYMIINIADVYMNHTINKICDPMNDFISALPDAVYKKTIGLRMNKRPNSGSDRVIEGKKSIYVEPMWVWQKVPF